MKNENFDNTIQFLNELLANEYVLFTKTLNFHWNFKGPHFASIHKLLEEHYNSLLETMDTTAERVKILKGIPLSTVKELGKEASLPENPGSVPSSNEMIAALYKDHSTIIGMIRTRLTEDKTSVDPGTEDLLSGILRDHEKMSWMLESNLH